MMLKNQLSKSTSPYLLQHKDNPVHWQEWSDEVLQMAKDQNKCLLISVGYSACHWCHVMAHECFEDEQVAAIMNKYFINIKIDREERPDIDQIYMEAAQLLTGRGGWPLNAFALPDGKPFYAGTYFPKDNWMSILKNIATAYKEQPQALIKTAEILTEGINNQDVFIDIDRDNLQQSEEELTNSYEKWFKHIDFKDGGIDKAPKFPMPVVWQSLLDYHIVYKNQDALNATTLALDKMYKGGIYDWVGGGFARYSVDGYWFAPHFEKMLYDNAQLVSLYADAYKVTKNNDYKDCIEHTIAFLNSELKHKQGSYYSALDADSEGVEGLYYTWTITELQKILDEKEFKIAKAYFGLKANGNWENKLNILAEVKPLHQLAEDFKISVSEAESILKNIKSTLKAQRSHRIRPGLDHKIITAHNGMMIKALAKAYTVTGESSYKNMAINLAGYMIDKAADDGYMLKRIHENTNSLGFLDDYAFFIEGLIHAYQISFEIDLLNQAKAFTRYTLENFYDEEKQLFYYTPHSNRLIARKIEYSDNVIPSSNGVMATNLWLLGHLTSDSGFITISKGMLQTVKPFFEEFKMYFALWHQLEIAQQRGQIEVAVTGPKAIENSLKLQKNYFPYTSFCGGNDENLPQLKGKIKPEEDQIFICQNQTCYSPFSNPDEALKMLKSMFK
jgi:uncharacterized protein YyaL (SSP411 family)